MNKCLVTTIKGSIDNDSLLKEGELRLKVHRVSDPENYNNGLFITVSEDTTMEIIGEGYFTDKQQSVNNGKTMNLTSGTWNSTYFSNGDYEISIKNKYVLQTLHLRHSSDFGRKTSNISINPNDLSSCRKLESLYVYDINEDISFIQNLVELNSLAIGDVFGNISALKNLSKLKSLYIGYNVYGDISAFNNSKLEEIHTTGKFSGDLSQLPSTCWLFNIGSNDKGSSFTWSSRESSASIISMPYSPTISDIDKMLIDQAACKAKDNISSEEPWKKAITARGTRTSASDAAISTLQSKGYTVSITSL